MILPFIHSFQSELIKKRRSSALWLVLLSSCAMPGLVTLVRLFDVSSTYAENNSHQLWDIIYTRNWGAMGMFFLPLSIILFASLITNLEFKNNTWKQIHTTPQNLSTIFFAKFAVILLLLLQLFIFFNIGIYLSAVFPSLVLRGIAYPVDPYPFSKFMIASLKFFVDCLPIISLQYLLSLLFKNFLVPIAVGFTLLIVSLLALNWKYGYLIPYTYCPLNFKENQGQVDPSVNIHVCAAVYFVIFLVAGYILYIRKKEKG
jgi:lantibiotic transport system permease protein